MEETANDIKTFLKEYTNDSSTSEFNPINPKIVGNYVLNRQDVALQVIDWILNYLEDRKCPYNLAISIAKETAQQIESSISEQQLKESVNSDGKLLNSLTLYNDAIKKLTLVCKSYLEEVDDMELQPFPLAYTASVFAVKNKRRKMEDRHVIHHDLNLLLDLKNCPRHSYFAVFDGHSGVDAASYASAHLHVNIANHPAFLTDTPTAIAEAYKTTDHNFSKKCYEENLKSGTTAVCALFREKTIFLSWVGDSQAVLVKDGKPAIVTSPHKPDREDEQKRVEDLGGTIQFIGTFRVNGMLAVTRAIGDVDHKPFISSEPEITIVDLDGSEDFLILACDGLWDGMSPDDVVSALYYNLLQNGQDDPFDTMAAKLVHQSKLQGSEDNITAVVIFLRDIKVIKEEAEKYIPHLSNKTLLINYFKANGDEKFFDLVTSTPISKPNVLEFNNSSIKKLKNTANVLSAAGLGDSFTDYVEKYHASNFDKLNEPAVHPVVAPETTALSELPTPPIDDVIASQQFDQICSTNLAQKFEDVATNKKSVSSDSNSPLNSPDINFDSNFTKCLELPKLAETASRNDKNSLLNEGLSPEEAVDIASTVVSNAIETAVKCISEKESETKTRVSPQKLNPYAEPFVMKSFCPPEADECNLINFSPSAPELNCSVVENTNVDYSKDGIEELITTETSSNEVKNNIEVITPCSPVLEKAQESVIELISSSDDLLLPTDKKIPAAKLSEDVPLIGDMQISLVENSVFEFGTPKEGIQSSFKEDLPIKSPHQIMANLINDEAKEDIVSVQNLSNAANTENNEIEGSVIEIASQDSVIEVSDGKISPLKEFLEIENSSNPSANNQNSLKQSEVICDSEVLVYQNIELIDISSDLANNDIMDSKSGCQQTVTCVESNNTADEMCVVTEISSPTDSSNVLIHEDQGSLSYEDPLKSDENEETGIHMQSDTIPEAAIILGGVTLPLVDDKAAAVLPSDHSEESHVETVAVDLQSVPVGVPEAEGVTEDIDSDSEKDGGWSYMKGNVAGEKNKSVSEKASKKDISGLKKDAQKSSTDVKSKIKITSNVDKNKKALAEKKPLEVKSKMSRPLPTNTGKTTIDKPKVPSTAQKVATTVTAKKPISAAKATTVAPSKMSKPATVSRSAPVQNKPGVPPSTSRIQTAMKTASSTATRLKPNTGVSTATPLTTTNSLVKKQPSTTQSTKSNTLSSARNTVNRPAASTVPNRALSATKPSTLQKTSLEAKPKQPVKQTVSSTLKKPEVKETKELSNKQLIERKSPLPKIASKGVASNASSSLKSSASGISKTAAKPRNVPPKSDLNKDVPKTAISRLAPRNATQMKSTKDSSKASLKSSLSFQKKAVQKTNQIVKPDDKKTDEATPSEEEKLLREVNDVEIAAKELADSTAAVDVQQKPHLENGHAPEIEEKILNDQSVSNPAENLL